MKKIGIIFALNEELNALKKYLEIVNEYTIFNLTFYEGKINESICYLVESGIGKVNSARTAQILIDNFDVDYIFNIGVAGGIDESLKIGDIVIGDKLVQHDFDCTAFNLEKGHIPSVGRFFESDRYLFKTAIEVLKNIKDISVRNGVIASGDIFCTDTNMSKKINTKFNALCVEMEGASIAQTCYLSNMPFLILRGISDVPNNNNKIDYDNFLEKSSATIAYSMKLILEKINEEI